MINGVSDTYMIAELIRCGLEYVDFKEIDPGRYDYMIKELDLRITSIKETSNSIKDNDISDIVEYIKTSVTVLRKINILQSQSSNIDISKVDENNFLAHVFLDYLAYLPDKMNIKNSIEYLEHILNLLNSLIITNDKEAQVKK